MSNLDESAFPIIVSDSINDDNHNVTNIWSGGGLSKREYMATHIAAGLANGGFKDVTSPSDVISYAVHITDGLLAELAKK